MHIVGSLDRYNLPSVDVGVSRTKQDQIPCSFEIDRNRRVYYILEGALNCDATAVEFRRHVSGLFSQ